MIARLVYMVAVRILGWLALLARRRSGLIVEVLVLRRELAVLRRRSPDGVTGLLRGIEAANQVMGTAGDLQVPDVHHALSSALGGMAQFANFTVFGDDDR